MLLALVFIVYVISRFKLNKGLVVLSERMYR